MILLIDNYDSFVYNLKQYLGVLGEEVTVRRNDHVTPAEIEAFAARTGAKIKIVETPPGPPVFATVVAEIYGQPHHRYDELIAASRTVKQAMAQAKGVVDVDDTVVTDLIDKLALRARANSRYVKVADIEKKLIEVTTYLTVLCRNYRDTEQYFKRT